MPVFNLDIIEAHFLDLYNLILLLRIICHRRQKMTFRRSSNRLELMSVNDVVDNDRVTGNQERKLLVIMTSTSQDVSFRYIIARNQGMNLMLEIFKVFMVNEKKIIQDQSLLNFNSIFAKQFQVYCPCKYIVNIFSCL